MNMYRYYVPFFSGIYFSCYTTIVYIVLTSNSFSFMYINILQWNLISPKYKIILVINIVILQK